MTLYLIASIASQRVAIAADRVESVVEIEAITPVPAAPAHVAGLAALRSRVLTLIDSIAALGLGTTALAGNDPAIVVVIDGHLYGLLVDRIEDVAEFADAPAALGFGKGAGWDRIAQGLIEGAEGPILLIDPAALVAGAADLAA